MATNDEHRREIEDNRKLRTSFMRWLYAVADASQDQLADPNEFYAPDKRDEAATGALRKVIHYLEGEDLVRAHWTMGGLPSVQLTHAGIAEMEQALMNPDRPTQHFAPMNMIRGTNAAHAPHISFDDNDCDVFARYPQRVHWDDKNVPVDDQDSFRSIRERLNHIARWASESAPMEIELKAFASTLQPNGRTPEDLWCCIYPSSAPNKSYALQVALLITSHGAELCICLVRQPKIVI